jgi:outer membrane lipase/esterase
VTVALGAPPARATAASFSDIYFFGDSLSDTGNLFHVTNGFPPAPYFNGRFSDGPLWTEKMASLLGHSSDAASFYSGGKNFAFAGARTGLGQTSPTDPVGVLGQVAGIWGNAAGPWGGVADPNALYVVVGGGNDLRDARSAPGSSDASRQAAAQNAADNLIQSIGFLASHGAEYVMVASVPDLGRTPEAVGLGLSAASTDATNRFNALMPSVIGAGNSLGLHMSFLDIAGISNLVNLDALANGGGIFGITNTTIPCLSPIAPACSVSAFSDSLHPSSRAHEIIGLFAANAALTTLAAVPEPETYAVLMAGLALIGGIARRRRAVAA